MERWPPFPSREASGTARFAVGWRSGPGRGQLHGGRDGHGCRQADGCRGRGRSRARGRGRIDRKDLEQPAGSGRIAAHEPPAAVSPVAARHRGGLGILVAQLGGRLRARCVRKVVNSGRNRRGRLGSGPGGRSSAGHHQDQLERQQAGQRGRDGPSTGRSDCPCAGPSIPRHSACRTPEAAPRFPAARSVVVGTPGEDRFRDVALSCGAEPRHAGHHLLRTRSGRSRARSSNSRR